MHSVLLDILEVFEISFPLIPFDQNYTGKNLIPSLLPDKEPNELNAIWPLYPKEGQVECSRIFKVSLLSHVTCDILKLTFLTTHTMFLFSSISFPMDFLGV